MNTDLVKQTMRRYLSARCFSACRFGARRFGARVVGVSLSLSLLSTMPQPTAALGPSATTRADSAAGSIEFRLAESGGTYTVYMQPKVTPAAPNATISAQVSIKVPHATGATRFEPSPAVALVTGTTWQLSSRSDAPPEAPGYDYLSFNLDFPDGDFRAFNWTAGTEVAVFSFTNSGAVGSAMAAHLVDNCDAFAPPNSQNAFVGNEIVVLGLGEGNAYAGNLDAAVDCPTPTQATSAVAIARHSSIDKTANVIHAGELVTYTYTVANTGLRSAEDLSLTIDLTGLADLHTANNSFAAANPVLYANQTATWHLGQLAPGAQGIVTVTLRTPASNDILTTTATINATNDNSSSDNRVQDIVQVIAQSTRVTHYIYLPVLNR